MRACAYCLEQDVNLPEDSDFAFNHSLWDRIKGLSTPIGFFMLVFGLPLAFAPAFDPERAGLSRLGWLLSFLGLLLAAGSFIKLAIKSKRIKAGYNFILANGTLFDAVVQEHLVYDGLVRELEFHKPILKDGVPTFFRQSVMMSIITININHNKIKFVTFRPEIIGVFNAGATIPVLWHPKWPKLFIPVQIDAL